VVAAIKAKTDNGVEKGRAREGHRTEEKHLDHAKRQQQAVH